MFSEIRMVKDIVDQAISANKVMMFSKTFCPFCTKAKDALKSVGASFEVMELENRSGKFFGEYYFASDAFFRHGRHPRLLERVDWRSICPSSLHQRQVLRRWRRNLCWRQER